MTPDEVRERVAEIAANAYDAEEAHSLEDALYRDVLRSIANDDVPRAMQSVVCELALAASSIKFSRWCA